MQFRHLLLLVCGLFLFACGTNTNPDEGVIEGTEEEQAEEMAERTVEPVDNTRTSGSASYTIEVLNADKASPRKEMSGRIDGAKIVVNYGSPRVKGRVVFGELEPWGKVWRAGADEATVITLEQDMLVGGETLPAGSYAFFLIPNETGDWTAIFNREYEQWGAYEYDEAADVLRVDVTPSSAETSAEEMDFVIEDGQLQLIWDKTIVPIDMTAA
jgi:hypothetical protein